MVLMLVVVFTGVSLTGPTSANADCAGCCKTCQAKYNAAVGGPPPSEADFRRSLENPPENYPEGLDCVVQALIAFGGCCALSNCLAKGNEAYFWVCVAWGLDVYYKCEAQYRTVLNSCQASCPCCSGC